MKYINRVEEIERLHSMKNKLFEDFETSAHSDSQDNVTARAQIAQAYIQALDWQIKLEKS